MYQASCRRCQRTLKALDAILDKAAANAAERKIDPEGADDGAARPRHVHLARQVQIATDHAKGCPARLAGVPVPKLRRHREDVRRN